MNNKDLIKQYVNLGLRLPEHQVNQLTGSDLKSYLRMRNIAIGHGSYENEILGYEYKKMDDEQKESLIKNLNHASIEDAMMTLNYRAGSDDFVKRLIVLRPNSDILENLIYILRNTHSSVNVIYELINVRGPIFNDNYNMSALLSYIESPDAKLKFCMEYLKLLSDKTKKNMTTINSPITAMLGKLDSVFCKTLSKYFIMLNSTKPKGNRVDGETFFAMLNNTSDSTFDELSSFMVAKLDLSPNQLEFIEKEKK
jgi:hypothetical protein